MIHPLTDDRRMLPIEKTGELVEAAPGFQLVISYNPGYQHVLKDLKPSTRQRFVALEFDFPPAELERRDRHARGRRRRARRRARSWSWAAGCGASATAGWPRCPSTRLLVATARLIAGGIAPPQACRVALDGAAHRRPRPARGHRRPDHRQPLTRWPSPRTSSPKRACTPLGWRGSSGPRRAAGVEAPPGLQDAPPPARAVRRRDLSRRPRNRRRRSAGTTESPGAPGPPPHSPSLQSQSPCRPGTPGGSGSPAGLDSLSPADVPRRYRLLALEQAARVSPGHARSPCPPATCCSGTSTSSPRRRQWTALLVGFFPVSPHRSVRLAERPRAEAGGSAAVARQDRALECLVRLLLNAAPDAPPAPFVVAATPRGSAAPGPRRSACAVALGRPLPGNGAGAALGGAASGSVRRLTASTGATDETSPPPGRGRTCPRRPRSATRRGRGRCRVRHLDGAGRRSAGEGRGSARAFSAPPIEISTRTPASLPMRCPSCPRRASSGRPTRCPRR